MAGCLAAANAVNAAGGVLRNKVVCSAVDTRGDPADAVTAAAKMLATTPHLLGVLGPSSDEADATAPLINAAKIPMFADTGEASFDQTKLQYFWRMTPADDVLGYAMALWAKEKGYLRAAAVFGNDVGSQSVVPTLLKGYSALGGQRARAPISRRSSSSSRPSRRSSSPKPHRRPTRRSWPSYSSWAT
jgi:ABC-type branched-subunit amino acid transport system substrate-binding protein